MWCTNTVIQTVIGLINRHNETTNVKPKTAMSSWKPATPSCFSGFTHMPSLNRIGTLELVHDHLSDITEKRMVF